MTEQSGQTDSVTQLQMALSQQGTLVGRHEAALQDFSRQQTVITNTLSQLSKQVFELSHQIKDSTTQRPATAQPIAAQPASSSATQAFREVTSPTPECFSGELNKTQGFLLQCSLIFNSAPHSFQTDASKISYIIGLLRGRALHWAQVFVAGSPIEQTTYKTFIDSFNLTFSPVSSQEESARKLWSLRQGNKTVADFSVEFRTLAIGSGWNAPALRSAFYQALNERVKDELASRDEPNSLDRLIDLAIKLDNRLRERNRARPLPLSPQSATESRRMETEGRIPRSPPPEPMQIGHVHLTPEERLRRRTSGLCLYCGSSRHFIALCPVRPKTDPHQ